MAPTSQPQRTQTPPRAQLSNNSYHGSSNSGGPRDGVVEDTSFLPYAAPARDWSQHEQQRASSPSHQSRPSGGTPSKGGPGTGIGRLPLPYSPSPPTSSTTHFLPMYPPPTDINTGSFSNRDSYSPTEAIESLYQQHDRPSYDSSDTKLDHLPLQQYSAPMASSTSTPSVSIAMHTLADSHEHHTLPNFGGTPTGGLTTPGSDTHTPRLGRSKDRSGYKSPRASSADGGQGGYGKWTGPARGASPYGPLGDTIPSGERSAASSNPNLLFADGDFLNPQSNAFSRFIFSIYDSTFIVRWIVYILPLLMIIWIPGIVGVTGAKNARVWGVGLLYWSIWLSVVWAGWWGAALVAKIMPGVLMSTVGVVAPEMKHYIRYMEQVQFYNGAAGWALAIWISFLPLVNNHGVTNNPSASTLALFTKGLFGIFIVLIILLVEKIVIQVVAHNFHKKSYEDRIAEQKYQIRVLTTLYLHSHDLGRIDTLDDAMKPTRPGHKRQNTDPTVLVKKAVRGVRRVAKTTTTIIGTIASEIAGERVLQPNSPAAMVATALASANKTKQLARRIYMSFTPDYRDSMILEDISKLFPNRAAAERAFAIFDRDTNGDANLEEMELSCLDIRDERTALSCSMRDIDSAVGRLDSIVMSLWYIVSVVIIVGLMDASFNTMIASAGTLVLGLSWLFAATAQEILASIIFLFVKHLYDVGDRVDIDGVSYVVLEMHLLSTIFRRTDGMVVQAPHIVLNQKFVNNVRRSGAIAETFTWDVDFATPFEKIEALRARMIEFLEVERRDFIPAIDISVHDFSGQTKMSLSADIKYRSNWQNGALKALRRNKWTCALKLCMAALEIYGPGGAGDPSPPPPDPIPYTVVPWNEKKEEKKVALSEAEGEESRLRDENKLSGVTGVGTGLRSRTAVIEEVEGRT